MLKEDNLVIGFAIGVMAPVLAYLAITYGLEGLGTLGVVGRDGLAFSFRPRTVGIIAICANLIPFKLYGNLRNDNSMRGILIATAIFAIAWFVKYGTELLSGEA